MVRVTKLIILTNIHLILSYGFYLISSREE